MPDLTPKLCPLRLYALGGFALLCWACVPKGDVCSQEPTPPDVATAQAEALVAEGRESNLVTRENLRTIVSSAIADAGPGSLPTTSGWATSDLPLPADALTVQAQRPEAACVKRGISTRDLYLRASALGVPLREGKFTKYHPNEASGLGGGWNTADGQGFRPGCIASATRWYPYWRGHELWVEGYGRSVIGDNGPGWSSKYRWDLAAFSAWEVNQLDRGAGILRMRYAVVRCPRPETCDCDFAQAWRKAGRP